MIDIELKSNQSAYEAIVEYIRRYWEHNVICTVIVALGKSYDGSDYNMSNEIVIPVDGDGIEFLDDWWEGERFVRISGIKSVYDLEITGGIYKGAV